MTAAPTAAPLAGVYFRAALPDDRAFVIDSWVESYKHAHAAGLIPMHMYQRVYRESFNWILSRPNTETIVGVGPEDVLLGWIGVDRVPLVTRRDRRRVDGRVVWVEELVPSPVPLVLFAYVKDAFRGMGIGRQLFAAAGIDLDERFLYASKLSDTRELVLKHAPHAHWAPIAARFGKP